MAKMIIEIDLDKVEQLKDQSPDPWHVGEHLETFGNRLKNYCRMPTLTNGPVRGAHDNVVGTWHIEMNNAD